MTRAERRLIITWARARRRFGAGSLQPSRPSRFLAEIPAKLTRKLGTEMNVPQIDLYLERQLVRESVERTAYTGKAYNSLDHIRQFFAEHGQPQSAPPVQPARPPVPKPRRGKGGSVGSVIEHPRYGRGTVVRREGEGDEAKLTVSFPGYGLKKLVQKYAGLKIDE
jgi:DNA helicase-2/ATP-dependent DNA helicase PcrA